MSEQPDLDRRRFVAATAAVAAGVNLGLLGLPTRTTAMTDVMELETAIEGETIRPFHYEASDADLADLRQRVKAARWPDRELVTDDSQGVQLSPMQKLAQY